MRAALDQAIALVGAGDRRIRRAERNYGEGVAALAAGDFARAIREFRSAYRVATDITG